MPVVGVDVFTGRLEVHLQAVRDALHLHDGLAVEAHDVNQIGITDVVVGDAVLAQVEDLERALRLRLRLAPCLVPHL